ncbi:MAG: glycine zipper 2TM domain-containing protein [Pseudomonadota bacterium]
MNTAANVDAVSKLRLKLLASGLALATAGVVLTPAPVQAQEQGYAGNIIGGVAGALLGSRIGSGSGQIAAAAAGGVLGSIVGGNVQAGLPQHRGYAYQPQTVQQPIYHSNQSYPAYSQPVYQSTQPGPYAYEMHRQADRVQHHRQYYPQQEVIRYEQPTYVRQDAPVYQHSYQHSAPAAQRGYTGPIVGGVAGALLGSRVGKGNGKIAATALGGVVGAVVGDRIQNAPYPVQHGYVQPSQPQYSQQPSGVGYVSYGDGSYSQRRYATPDQY